jgi:hypothetical protein
MAGLLCASGLSLNHFFSPGLLTNTVLIACLIGVNSVVSINAQASILTTGSGTDKYLQT